MNGRAKAGLGGYWALALALLLVVLAFTWGLGAGIYHVFPYELIRSTKNLVEQDKGERPPVWVLDRTIKAAAEQAMLPADGDNLMLGDSVTAIPHWAELFPTKSFVERGNGGDTVTGTLMRAPRYLAAKRKKIFLMVGINDALFRLPEAGVLARYDKLVHLLTGSGAKVYVQSILDCGAACDNSPDGRESRRIQRAINAGLPAIAARHGAIWIDLNPQMSRDGRLRPEYSADGLHPNARGVLAWRDMLASHLRD